MVPASVPAAPLVPGIERKPALMERHAHVKPFLVVQRGRVDCRERVQKVAMVFHQLFSFLNFLFLHFGQYFPRTLSFSNVAPHLAHATKP